MKTILAKTAVVVLTLMSAASFASEQAPASAVSATDTANNVYSEDKLNIVVTPAQSEFIIKLKSNPTTGYSWFLREYDASVIKPVKHGFEASTKKLLGAPGYELWTFKVQPAGFVVPMQTTIRMIYARPWQGSESTNQIVFHVTTQSK